MASLKDLNAKYKALVDILVRDRESESLRIAFDHTTLVKSRVQGKSLDYQGQPFADYNQIYAKYGRRAKGFQSNKVDFNRSGRMWASVRPVVTESDLYSVKILITSQNPEDNIKLQGQYSKGNPKRGNIIRSTETEIKVVAEAHKRRVLAAYKEAGFNIK